MFRLNCSCYFKRKYNEIKSLSVCVDLQDPTPKERAPVSGRVQLQVWYNDDKNELVVSVFAADDLAPRDDPIYGSHPEAYLQLRLLPFTYVTHF